MAEDGVHEVSAFGAQQKRARAFASCVDVQKKIHTSQVSPILPGSITKASARACNRFGLKQVVSCTDQRPQRQSACMKYPERLKDTLELIERQAEGEQSHWRQPSSNSTAVRLTLSRCQKGLKNKWVLGGGSANAQFK